MREGTVPSALPLKRQGSIAARSKPLKREMEKIESVAQDSDMRYEGEPRTCSAQGYRTVKSRPSCDRLVE